MKLFLLGLVFLADAQPAWGNFRERRSVLDDLDQVDVETDDSNCGEGKVYNADEQTCVDCGPGSYADLNNQICVLCPYDTFSDEPLNVACKACDNGKRTLFKGSDYKALCTDICTVPKTTKSYYETETSLLSPSDRVISGTKIFFQCIDQDHRVKDTDSFYMILTCTSSTSSELPTVCTNPNEANEGNGLICYDSCLRESSGVITRYLKIENGVFTTLTESCALSECQGNDDICVAASHTTADKIEKTLFTCEASTTFDSEICSKFGADEENCKINKCSKDRCNDPKLFTSHGTSKSHPFTLLIVSLVVVYLSP